MYGQTLQNPTFGTVTTKTAPTVTSVNHLATVEASGVMAKIVPTSNIIQNASIALGATVTDALNNLNNLNAGAVYKKTIAQIRSLSGTLPTNNFYTTDINQEGDWYYDASDTISADNTGTILVTSDGKRIKRITGSYYSVKWFGAKGDNSTDDTVAIQSTINAVDLHGGGTVFIPNGRYIIGGTLNATSNSQLYIPLASYTNPNRNHITIKGESKPNMLPVGGGLSGSSAVVLNDKCVILKSTKNTFTTARASVIGTGYATGALFNETFLTVEDIAIQVISSPQGNGPVIGGINYAKGGSIVCKNVTVYIDEAGIDSDNPTNDIAAFESIDVNAETYSVFDGTLAVGFKHGYVAGEHVVFNNSAQAMCCYNGVTFKDSSHNSTAVRFLTQWCAVSINVTNRTVLANFNLDVEWLQSGKWYDSLYTVNDPAGKCNGRLYYTIVESFVGVNNSKFTINGTSPLNYASHNSEVYNTSENVNRGVFFKGVTGRKLANSLNFIWNDTTNRLGINSSTTPLADIEVSGTALPSIMINTSSSTGSPLIRWGKQNTNKWGIGIDIDSNGTSDFWFFDYVSSLSRMFFTSTGIVRIGADAKTSSATSGITVLTDQKVGVGITPTERLHVNGAIKVEGVIKLKSYTVSTLPTGVQGDTAYVTDATAPTYLGVLTGGGSVKCPVFYNGTAWVAH